MMKSSTLFERGPLPPYVHLASTRRHSRDRCSQAFPVLHALPLLCIILNANRRTKNGGDLGTRLCATNVRGYLHSCYFPTITVIMCTHMQLLLTVVFYFVFCFLQKKLLHFLKELAQHFVVRLKKYVCSLRVSYRGEVEMVCGGCLWV